MVGDPYDSVDDPACYPNSNVLINLANLQTQAELDGFEVEAVGLRSLHAPPAGSFDPAHYRALHRHLFRDVYSWAGKYRTVRTSKGRSMFCYPENIAKEMDRLFSRLKQPVFLDGSDSEDFVSAIADFLGDLNAIHPFREGNGRAQLYFVRMLGLRAGHRFRAEAVERDPFLSAMIQSYYGSMDALIDELERMIV